MVYNVINIIQLQMDYQGQMDKQVQTMGEKDLLNQMKISDNINESG